MNGESVEGRSIELLAPTWLEYVALRSVARSRGVRRTGIGLTGWKGARGSCLVLCGLAGGLTADAVPGTVVIPRSVGMPDGSTLDCDADLHAALLDAARKLGHAPRVEPVVTVPYLVTGVERDRWAALGFFAADMESGLLDHTGVPFATIRVILDAPARPISSDWLHRRAVADPRRWAELVWMAGMAPRLALRAARIAALAVREVEACRG